VAIRRRGRHRYRFRVIAGRVRARCRDERGRGYAGRRRWLLSCGRVGAGITAADNNYTQRQKDLWTFMDALNIGCSGMSTAFWPWLLRLSVST
jgi:hypothetical protein